MYARTSTSGVSLVLLLHQHGQTVCLLTALYRVYVVLAERESESSCVIYYEETKIEGRIGGFITIARTTKRILRESKKD